MDPIDFILKAKLSGYASGGEGQERKFDDGSVGFEIASDGFRYLDRYNSFNPFAESEHIFDSSNELLWVMNYFGEVLPSRPALWTDGGHAWEQLPATIKLEGVSKLHLMLNGCVASHLKMLTYS